jgi:signal transduction histidine kinase
MAAVSNVMCLLSAASLTACWGDGGAASAEAAPLVAKVVVDGREVAMAAAGDGRPAVRLPVGTRRLEIHVADAASEASGDSTLTIDAQSAPSGRRLRHRLEGVDDQWRDGPAHARALLQFYDAAGDTIDNLDTGMHGESADWRSNPERSAFAPYRLDAIAPPLSDRVTVNFLSHGGNELVGSVGIDEIELAITRPPAGGMAEPVRHRLVIDTPSAAAHSRATPTGWTRRGSRGDMALVGQRPRPEPHPILVLFDNDPRRYGNWSLMERVPVGPGDRVTLTWKAAHSLGVGGAAVAVYDRLEAGRYRFRAGLFLPEGSPTGEETSLSIEVFVPWHRQPWVWAAGAALLAGSAVAAARSLAMRRIQLRLEELERAHALERERTRIARDLHDEVGAGLTEIAMQNFWVHREMAATAPPATLERVERARQSAVDLVRSVDAIVWAVNPANDTLDRFVPYLTHAVEQFLEAAGVRARLDVPEDVPAVAIEGAMRHSLFRIVREAVNNAVKHGRPQHVGLAIRVADGRLMIDVEDDGRGIDPRAAADAAGERSGLENMRLRSEELGGRCTIMARPEGGTRVSIEVPLPTAAATESRS